MSLRADAYTKIREMILRGRLSSGERTSERTIAERYVHMSRTPVREALAVLTATGVLDQIPQVGVEVRSIDADQTLQAVRLRMGMESVIVDELAGGSGIDSRELRDAMQTMESASQTGDRIEFMLADTRLHTELARLGGFTTSVTTLQGLRDRVHLFRLQQPLTEPQMREIVDEHRALISAIEDRDRSRADEAIRVHLEATKARIEGAKAGKAEREPELAASER